MEWAGVQIDDSLRLRLIASPHGIRAIDFHCSRPAPDDRNDTNEFIVEAVHQLRAYFERRLRRFDVPLDIEGTDFQKRVWRQLVTIPYGETRSYAQIAAAIGASRAVRATGAATARSMVLRGLTRPVARSTISTPGRCVRSSSTFSRWMGVPLW